MEVMVVVVLLLLLHHHLGPHIFSLVIALIFSSVDYPVAVEVHLVEPVIYRARRLRVGWLLAAALLLSWISRGADVVLYPSQQFVRRCHGIVMSFHIEGTWWWYWRFGLFSGEFVEPGVDTIDQGMGPEPCWGGMHVSITKTASHDAHPGANHCSVFF